MVKDLLLKFLKFCIKYIRPFLGPYGVCRFTPTCSAYALEAVDKHGCAKGLFLATKRLLRCHPFCKGGYDPVP